MTELEIARSMVLCARASVLLAETAALIHATRAQIAKTQNLIDSVDRVSRQFMLFAADGSERLEFLAGDRAPETADYLELNVFGTQTARARWLVRGQPFPTTPVGYSWKRAPSPSSPSDAEHLERPALRFEKV